MPQDFDEVRVDSWGFLTFALDMKEDLFYDELLQSQDEMVRTTLSDTILNN